MAAATTVIYRDQPNNNYPQATPAPPGLALRFSPGTALPSVITLCVITLKSLLICSTSKARHSWALPNREYTLQALKYPFPISLFATPHRLNNHKNTKLLLVTKNLVSSSVI